MYSVIGFTIHTQLFHTFLNQYYRHICTYLNAFLMVIQNIVTKFQKFDIFDHFVTLLTRRLLIPAMWKVLISNNILSVGTL